ncbi:DoxX family protein [Brevibacillus agri]|uniref:DoxX family protein n=1 Tax=Brevibacillus agri TaxID=51101 RepID=UPI001C8EF371|nr:DoxX family protein [Brevibacillus agri]MBY0054588.1 DoxX family protein [Brevibacillus agri]MDN4094491.1 DoxX family protein [Brevibacillus agri]MED1643294.1 DoxX family protein [Brevibacillus agri]MED1656496.1 DoxX family protein [Brevibacillus agri]MED1685391.1 DoxX family protein [Brevibacillus agri]
MAYEKAFTVLRMTTGLLFLLHGLAKLQKGMDPVTQMFGDLGLPWWLAYLVLGIELIGGLAFLLGIGAKYAAWGLAGVMTGAIVTVKWKQGFIGGYNLDLILLAVTICVGFQQTKARPG